MKKEGLINHEYVHTLIKRRERNIHKGDCGRVLIVAGTKGMAGAAILCGSGALRGGAGIVRISATEDILPIVQTALPEATCVSRDLTDEEIQSYDAIAIGPGLGDEQSGIKKFFNDNEHMETINLIKKILEVYKGPLVLDADALNIISKNNRMSWLVESKSQKIITPHIGEARRLLGVKIDEHFSDRNDMAKQIVSLTCGVVLLKGQGTIVATPEGLSYTNTTGNPGMATGGSGDVLTGLIAALAGQSLSIADSAVAGAYLHGLAGDLGAKALGEFGLMAGDIAAFVALAIKKTVEDEKS